MKQIAYLRIDKKLKKWLCPLHARKGNFEDWPYVIKCTFSTNRLVLEIFEYFLVQNF